MKKLVKITGALLLTGILVVLLIVIKMYNKPHKDIQGATPDVVITAGDLVQEFEMNEEGANENFLDRIIQVEGEVAAISTSNGNSLITLNAPNAIGTVVCNMDASQNKKVLGIEKGSVIQVRGVCTGFLMDVMLVRAVIVD